MKKTVLEISTANIKPSTAKKLDAQPSMYCMANYGYGYLLQPCRELIEELPEDMSDLKLVIAYALGAWCEYVVIDADAEVCEDLPVYEWSKGPKGAEVIHVQH